MTSIGAELPKEKRKVVRTPSSKVATNCASHVEPYTEKKRKTSKNTRTSMSTWTRILVRVAAKMPFGNSTLTTRIGGTLERSQDSEKNNDECQIKTKV